MVVSPKKVFTFYVEILTQRSLEDTWMRPYPATDKVEGGLLIIFLSLCFYWLPLIIFSVDALDYFHF